MKRGILITTVLLSLVLIISLQLVDAGSCVPGPFDETHFCNITGGVEILKDDYDTCLNDYECKSDSCVYGKKTLCVNTSVDVDCSDWNNDEFGCEGETECEWYVSAQDEFFCESEYAAVKERGNFLQVFLQKIIDLFTQVFTREPPTELGAVPYPINVRAVSGGRGCTGILDSSRCDDLYSSKDPCEEATECAWMAGDCYVISTSCSYWNDNEIACKSIVEAGPEDERYSGCTWQGEDKQINLKWDKVSILRHVPIGIGSVIKSFPTEKITGQIIGSGGITGASVVSYSKYSCVGKTSCSNRGSRDKCNAAWSWGLTKLAPDICKWDDTLEKCFPKRSCYQYVMAEGINKDTCETDLKDCYWITNTLEREYEPGMAEGGEVLVIFENSKGGEECYTRTNHVVVCNHRACHSHNNVGIKCDEATAEAYCKTFGFEGYVENSKKCDDETNDHDHQRWASKVDGREYCYDSPGGERAKWILTMKCTEPMRQAACRGTISECTHFSGQYCPTVLGCEVGTDDTAVSACETIKKDTCIPACETAFTSCDDVCEGDDCDDCEYNYEDCIDDCEYDYDNCVIEAKSCQEGDEFTGDCGVFSYRSECRRYGCEWVTEVTTPQGTFSSEEISELVFEFDATNIGDFYSYTWSLGNTNIGSDRIITHEFTLSGTYVVKLTVIDEAGNEYELTQSVTVNTDCGNGLVRGEETCDPPQEGCDDNCQVEEGWDCFDEDDDGDSECYREEETVNASNYTIYRSNFSSIGYLLQGIPLSESGYVEIAEVSHDDVCVGNDCNWTDISGPFEEGYTYYYIVTAVSNDGIEGDYSDEVSARVPDVTNPLISFDDDYTTSGTAQGASLDQNYIEATVIASDNYRISSIIIQLYDETGALYDYSDMSTSSPFYYKFGKHTPLPNGVYYLNASVWDTSGNSAHIGPRRINISLEDLENPTIEFTEETTEEGEIYENSINAEVNASDDRGINSITIYLYNSTGLCREELISPPNQPTSHIADKEFEDLPSDTYFLNASVTDRAGKISITETREITVKEIPEGESYPTVAFVPPIPTGEYFPDSDDLVVEINITDNLGDISWTLSSNVSGYIDGGTTTLSHIEETLDLTGLLVSVNNIDVHKITLEATDSIGLTSSDSFDITIKNENCTDGNDNDGDGIFDGLDRDCATEPGAVALKITDLLAPPNVDTHRKINVNCKYETVSQDTKSIGVCIKLTLNNNIMACKSKIVDADSNTTKFRDCDVGGQAGTDAEIKCFVSDNCNRESPEEQTDTINITKFSICKYRDVGEENIILSLIEPEEDDAFDPEDENEIDIEILVTNENIAGESLPVIVEAWLYDIDEENKLANVTSEVVTIDYPIEETFELTMTVPYVEFSENNRLYYKAYMENKERQICESKSISLVLQEGDCIDADGDGYCKPPDCNDTDASINPGADEICTDGIDNDCDGLIDEEDPDCDIPDDQIIVIATGKSDDAGALTTRGVQRIMHFASILNFKIATVSHSVLVKTITSNSVTLTISSAPFDVSLTTGQIKDVDTDKDGAEDLRIKFNGIVNGAADITFRSIYTAPPGDGDGDGNGDGNGDEDGGIGIGWIIFIFVLVIGIAVVIALIFLRKKREGVGLRPRGPPGPTGFAPRRPPPRPPPTARVRRPSPRPAPPRYSPPR